MLYLNLFVKLKNRDNFIYLFILLIKKMFSRQLVPLLIKRQKSIQNYVIKSIPNREIHRIQSSLAAPQISAKTDRYWP